MEYLWTPAVSNSSFSFHILTSSETQAGR